VQRIVDNSEVTSVFIIADSDVVRAGLESLVAGEAGLTVAGSAADFYETAAQVTEGASPAVVIFDAERQGEETLRALRPFIEDLYEGVDVPALVVIGAEGEEWVREALREGLVQAALPGVASSGEIIAAVLAVSNGLIALDAETFASVLSTATPAVNDLTGAHSYSERSPSVEPLLDALTPREREVLEMLAEGLSNKEIAWRMKISEHTVKFHIASIFGKLGASTRTEAVMQGIRRGLVMI
jgi:NarL family two-component system response regulator YdfI